uniref:Zgc:194878 [Danio rerio] n=1 Tax=Lepeophtheirus salmonis TaxID=72036 RepID=A0A0K2TB97_LEPSM
MHNPLLKYSLVYVYPKKEDPVEMGEYRPITILPHVTHTFHNVIANRLKQVPTSECQILFSGINGCSENSLILRTLLQLATKSNKKKRVAVAFLDFANPFDSVSHESLLKASTRLGLPPLLLKYLTNVYGNNFTTLHGKENIKFKSGILQGDPLSGYLCHCVFNWCLAEINKTTKIGFMAYQLGKETIKYFLFADDAVLVSEDAKSLQQICVVLLDQCKKVGLNANYKKCAYTLD